MLLTSRQKRILERVKEGARIDELQEWLGVSEATVRRDLRRLAAQGLLTRVRGGAIDTAYPLPAIDERATEHAAEKERIGKAAAAMVADRSTIIVDTGSTTRQMLPFLQGKQGVTLITRDLDIATAATQVPGLEVVMLGGAVDERHRSVAGALALKMLRHFYADQCFLGGVGLSMERGLLTGSPEEAQMKREVMRRCRQRVVLMDASKVGGATGTLLAPVSDLHTIISDTRVAPEHAAKLQAAGIRLNLV